MTTGIKRTGAFVMNTEPYTKLINIWCEGTGWIVKWMSTDHENNTVPRIDPVRKVAEIPSPSPYWDDNQITVWFGQIMHELGHAEPAMIGVMNKSVKEQVNMDSFFGMIINIIEDYRQERHGLGEFKGRDQALSLMNGTSLSNIAEMLREKPVPEDIEDADKVRTLMEVSTWIARARGRWQPDVVDPAQQMEELYPTDKYDKYTPELDSLKGYMEEEVFALARKIIDEDHDSEEEEEKATSDSQEGEQQQGEGEGDEQGEGGKSESRDSGDEEGEAASKALAHYADLMDMKHASEDVPDGSPLKIVYDHDGRRDFEPLPFTKTHDCTGPCSSEPDSATLSVYEKGHALASTTKRLLQTMSQSMYLPGHRRGKINGRALASVPSGRKDVFRKKHDGLTLDTAVTILVDMSGSMLSCDWEGASRIDKYSYAAASAAALNDAISTNGIPLEIIGFTQDSDTGAEHFLYKTFDKKVSSHNIMSQFRECKHHACQNSDGESILFAFNRLRQRTEKRRVLITLSDGQPAASARGDCFTYTKEVVKNINKEVECYGIGILDDSVKEIYPDYTVLKDAADLESCLIEVVKSKLI